MHAHTNSHLHTYKLLDQAQENETEANQTFAAFDLQKQIG